jgi:hypothetical protein
MSIDEQLSEGRPTSLETTAAFDRPWVDESVAWVFAGPIPVPGPVIDVGCGAGGARPAPSPTGCAATTARPASSGSTATRAWSARAAPGPRRRTWPTLSGGRSARWGACRPGPGPPAWCGPRASSTTSPTRRRPSTSWPASWPRAGASRWWRAGSRCAAYPHEIGLGRPGLESRLDKARARWFSDLRSELAGPPLPYGWPEALARARLGGRACPLVRVEATAPARRHRAQHRHHAPGARRVRAGRPPRRRRPGHTRPPPRPRRRRLDQPAPGPDCHGPPHGPRRRPPLARRATNPQNRSVDRG